MSDRPSSRPPVTPDTPVPSSDTSHPGVMLRGIAGSPGVAIGPALVVGDTRTAYGRRHIAPALIDAETSCASVSATVTDLCLPPVQPIAMVR